MFQTIQMWVFCCSEGLQVVVVAVRYPGVHEVKPFIESLCEPCTFFHVIAPSCLHYARVVFDNTCAVYFTRIFEKACKQKWASVSLHDRSSFDVNKFGADLKCSHLIKYPSLRSNFVPLFRLEKTLFLTVFNK